jgi:hypothetical protein
VRSGSINGHPRYIGSKPERLKRSDMHPTNEALQADLGGYRPGIVLSELHERGQARTPARVTDSPSPEP